PAFDPGTSPLLSASAPRFAPRGQPACGLARNRAFVSKSTERAAINVNPDAKFLVPAIFGDYILYRYHLLL
ncbi:MAG: hypothetical protein KGQ45_16935, partial [Burkholderiales bacterium]|nr:hypothetical protein [Burkholderiales bacterium]